MSEEIKKFLYLNRRAPYGTIYAWEALEVVLIGAAFDQDVSLAFFDDGVYVLLRQPDLPGPVPYWLHRFLKGFVKDLLQDHHVTYGDR